MSPGGNEPALDESDREDFNPGLHETALFAPTSAEEYRNRWNDIQVGFVDGPGRAVVDADALVAEVIERVAETLAHERGRIEHEWRRTDPPSTEDLRVALQRYHAFIERLLST